MQLFECPHCGNRLYFENAQCLSCGNKVLYAASRRRFVPADGRHPPCANAASCGCNWTAADGPFCLACSLNKTIPDLSVAGNRERWSAVEQAKKRAVVSLLAFALQVRSKRDADDDGGLAFDFLAPIEESGPGSVRTGHDNGLITLNVAEADASEREKMRAAMGENYRTLLGHFRHELGHFAWDRLICDDPARLEAFRERFGDERLDYEQALARHYAKGSPPPWSPGDQDCRPRTAARSSHRRVADDHHLFETTGIDGLLEVLHERSRSNSQPRPSPIARVHAGRRRSIAGRRPRASGNATDRCAERSHG